MFRIWAQLAKWNPISFKFRANRAYYTPACSETALLSTGLSQSLHLITPISDVDDSGRAPNSFMSRAGSHTVVGSVTAEISDGGGDGEGRASQEKGSVGGVDAPLSLSGICVKKRKKVVWEYLRSLLSALSMSAKPQDRIHETEHRE